MPNEEVNEPNEKIFSYWRERESLTAKEKNGKCMFAFNS